MPALDLPPLHVLLTGALALALVLLAWYGIMRLRRPTAGGMEENELQPILLPSAGAASHSTRSWLTVRGPGAGAWWSRVAAGATVLVLLAGIIGLLLLPGTGTGAPGAWVQRADRPSMTSAPSTATVSTRPRPSAEGASAMDPVTGERLVVWSGDAQAGRPGRLLRRSLGVLVQDSAGRPVADRAVVFAVEPGGGELASARVNTTRSGLALTSWRLGREPGALSVRAHLADKPTVSVRFIARLDSSVEGGSERRPSPAEERVPASEGEPQSPPPAMADEESTPPAPAVAEVEPGAPAPAAPALRAWSPGGMHTCRLGGSGGIACEGVSELSASERAVESLVRSVAAGVNHVCGITTASTVACWPVGVGAGESLRGEQALPEGAVPGEIAVGAEHICARSAGGGVYCWGSNSRGQLGREGRDRAAPIAVAGVADVVSVASGWFHSCALTASGQLYCWGANGSGQLGVGTNGDGVRPERVPRPAPFLSVTAGSAHTCALTAGGEAWCWGQNRYGQLGIAAADGSSRPAPVETELRFEALAAGGVHTCGLTGSGRAWCWGRNVFGQLGDGSLQNSPVPAPVEGGYRFDQLAAGGAHTCGETVEGALYCWGSNLQGQLGDGSRENRSTPVRSAGG